jgi:hypothetical protein
MPADNAISKARGYLSRVTKKVIKIFRKSDTTVVIHVPGHAQGKPICVLDGVTPQQSLGILQALSNRPDPRIERLISLVKDQVAADEALAGTVVVMISRYAQSHTGQGTHHCAINTTAEASQGLRNASKLYSDVGHWPPLQLS